MSSHPTDGPSVLPMRHAATGGPSSAFTGTDRTGTDRTGTDRTGTPREHAPVSADDVGPMTVRMPAAADAAGELADAVLDTLMKLGHRVRGGLDSRFAGLKMTDARYMALKVVQESAPDGCTQAKLAAALGQCESSISTLVERMRTGRLVYRLHPKSDRRKRVLLLTDLGREALAAAEECRSDAAKDLCETLSLDERESLCGLLGRLLSGVENADADAGRRRPAA